MLRISWFFVLYAINGAFAQSDCVPDAVRSLSLSANYTLSWSPSQNCDMTNYIIYVHGEFDLDHIFQIDTPSLDVSFLPACERYRFIVVAHSQNSISLETAIDALIPVPPEAELEVTYFNISQNNEIVLLEWDVDEKYFECVHYYRVVIMDRLILPVVRDHYLNTNSLRINNLSPCVDYEISVRAIYNLAIEGPITVTHYETLPAPTPAPTLEYINLADTYVNLTWRLPYYVAHRCPITSIIVDGSPYYNHVFPVTDNPSRPTPSTMLVPLRSDSMYFLRVYVENSAGVSPPYQIAVNTLP